MLRNWPAALRGRREKNVEITFRDAATVVHGMFFGGLLMLTVGAAIMGLYATSATGSHWTLTPVQARLFSGFLALIALLAWITVLLGAYVIYPWYRAHAPAGTLDLSGYPQRLLMSKSSTTGWHDIGMEWKEHIAWFAPISLTVVAYLFSRYGKDLHALKSVRRAIFGLIALAFFATCVAAFFGAMLNKFAPVRGGSVITLMHEESHDE